MKNQRRIEVVEQGPQALGIEEGKLNVTETMIDAGREIRRQGGETLPPVSADSVREKAIQPGRPADPDDLGLGMLAQYMGGQVSPNEPLRSSD